MDLSNLKSKSLLICSSVSALAFPFIAFAAEGDTTTSSGVVGSMTTAFTQIQTDFMSVVSAVGPIALAIVGAFMLWRLGARFFKSLAK